MFISYKHFPLNTCFPHTASIALLPMNLRLPPPSCPYSNSLSISCTLYIMALFSKAVKPTPTVKMPATAAKSTTVAPPTTTAAPTAASSQQTSCRPTTSQSASSNLPSNDASMCQASAPNRTQPLDKVSELQVSRSPAPETTTSNEAFKSDYEPNLVLDREDYLLK